MNPTEQEICCPRFDPRGWDKATHIWSDKRFIKGAVRTLMNIPINFGKVMTKLNEAVEEAGGSIPDNLCLSEHASKSNMNVYLATDREIPGADNLVLNGTYFSAVYEGDYKNIGTWLQEYERLCTERGLSIKNTYMWYTTCPKCSKKYGENYVAIIGEVTT